MKGQSRPGHGRNAGHRPGDRGRRRPQGRRAWSSSAAPGVRSIFGSDSTTPHESRDGSRASARTCSTEASARLPRSNSRAMSGSVERLSSTDRDAGAAANVGDGAALVNSAAATATRRAGRRGFCPAGTVRAAVEAAQARSFFLMQHLDDRLRDRGAPGSIVNIALGARARRFAGARRVYASTKTVRLLLAFPTCQAIFKAHLAEHQARASTRVRADDMMAAGGEAAQPRRRF